MRRDLVLGRVSYEYFMFKYLPQPVTQYSVKEDLNLAIKQCMHYSGNILKKCFLGNSSLEVQGKRNENIVNRGLIVALLYMSITNVFIIS